MKLLEVFDYKIKVESKQDKELFEKYQHKDCVMCYLKTRLYDCILLRIEGAHSMLITMPPQPGYVDNFHYVHYYWNVNMRTHVEILSSKELIIIEEAAVKKYLLKACAKLI